MNSLIPKDFFRIAESEFLQGTGEIYFNRERNKLLLIIDGEIIGFVDPIKLEVILHCLKDVHEMRGRYGPV